MSSTVTRKPHPLLGSFFAEMLGTFILTMSGTATLLGVARMSGSISLSVAADIAVSIAFGFGILAAVYLTAEVSGAHINPAVTLGLAVARRFPWGRVPAYLVAQFVGGILAGLMNWFMFGDKLRSALMLGATQPGPGVGWGTALFTEFVLTFILITVVMATAVYERAPGGALPAGLAIGLWIATAVFLALPISGGSLNPARTIGPMIASVNFPYWWVYVLGPVGGGVAGAVFWELVLKKGRTPEAAEEEAPEQRREAA